MVGVRHREAPLPLDRIAASNPHRESHSGAWMLEVSADAVSAPRKPPPVSMRVPNPDRLRLWNGIEDALCQDRVGDRSEVRTDMD